MAIGCAHRGRETRDSAPVEITVGETTPEGRLVFFEWVTKESREHRHAGLIGDYGMMVFYDYSAKPPVPPRFELYAQADRTIIKTTDLDAFIRQLDRLPRGATLDWYDKCCVSTHYRLPDEITRATSNACAERGIVLRQGPDPDLTICTCP